MLRAAPAHAGPLRILFAAYPELLTPVLRVIQRVIAGFLLKRAGLKRATADARALTRVQRFGSAANLNIHLHCLVLAGVYRRTEGEPVVQQARAPTGDALRGLLDKRIARLMKLLTRQGYLIEEHGMTCLVDIDADKPLASLQAASCAYRIASGPRAGQKVLSLRMVPGRDETAAAGLCADTHGFSLHAGGRCGAHQRKRLERLCGLLDDVPAQAFESFEGAASCADWKFVYRAQLVPGLAPGGATLPPGLPGSGAPSAPRRDWGSRRRRSGSASIGSSPRFYWALRPMASHRNSAFPYFGLGPSSFKRRSYSGLLILVMP